MTNKKLLVFGGTVFIGKTFFDLLKQQEEQYDIYCLNRGTVYWNDDMRKDHPHIKHISCNRKDPASVKETLLKLNKDLGISIQNKWAAVLDFSAYFQEYLTPTTVLSGLIEKYIIISTDSVYNNSLSRIKNPIPQDIFQVEKELPNVEKEPIADDYGYNKLKCQVFLNRQRPYPFICMRLPDVLGEYDQFQSSQRVWCTQQLVSQSQQSPIPITQKMRTNKLSFIDSHDVGNMMIQLMKGSLPPHQEYNFACDETPTLLEFYQIIGECLGIKMQWVEAKKEGSHFFPSVESGVIDTSRAKKELGFKATPLKETVARCVNFYLYKGPLYEKERQMMEAEFKIFMAKLAQ